MQNVMTVLRNSCYDFLSPRLIFVSSFGSAQFDKKIDDPGDSGGQQVGDTVLRIQTTFQEKNKILLEEFLWHLCFQLADWLPCEYLFIDV